MGPGELETKAIAGLHHFSFRIASDFNDIWDETIKMNSTPLAADVAAGAGLAAQARPRSILGSRMAANELTWETDTR